MSRIYAVITQKGGVGKTTTVNALSSSFSKQGFKVLAVDMDPQGNLSYSTGADGEQSTIFDALMGTARVKNCVQKLPMADVIPSNILLTGAEMEFTGKNREFVLKKVLQVINDDYDYIFIDSPPGLGFLTVNALAASNYAIIPMLPDAFSLQGIVQVYETIGFAKKACNPNLEIAGVLINKFSRFSRLHQESAGTARMIAKDYSIPVFDTYIRSSSALSEAQSLQRSIFEYAPRAAGVKDFYKLSQEILNSF